MKKLRIFLDSDEVLMNFMDPLLEKYNAYYGVNVKPTDITSWEINNSLPKGTDVYPFMKEPSFFKDLEPYPFACELIQKLMDDGHEVFIATASLEESIMDKYASFKKHFPQVKFEQILMIKRKDLLQGDILLDDGLHNISATSCKYPVIMTKGWNKEASGLRVSNLEEFYELVCAIAKEEVPTTI